MRTIVFDSDIIEREVKPHSKLNIFRDMLEKEVREKLTAQEILQLFG